MKIDDRGTSYFIADADWRWSVLWESIFMLLRRWVKA